MFSLHATQKFSHQLRANTLRMVASGNSSHIGSVLSVADIISTLYSGVLHVDPLNPQLDDRDRFILSKGHAGASVYSALAQRGFFSSDLLSKHYTNGSDLSGHVSHHLPGVEFSTGSLGHGLPVACGLAHTLLNHKKSSAKVFVVLSDGELDEGSNWESFLFASHHLLSNLYVIIDFNNLQSLDTTTNTLNLNPLGDKFRSFNWDVSEFDGHCHQSIYNFCSHTAKSKPKIGIARTIKGKGIDFMENSVLWHYRSPNQEELSEALSQIPSV